MRSVRLHFALNFFSQRQLNNANKSPLNALPFGKNLIIIKKETFLMACVTLHPALQSISGRIGNIVFYSSKGQQFARSYVIPRNPNTAAQRERRTLFAEAVTRWQSLSEHSKEKWNRKALGTVRTGYTLFISQFCTGINSGSENISFIPDKDPRICRSVSAVTSSQCIFFSPDRTTYSLIAIAFL
jgi:hypothetical protein